ncbi:MAG: hypothetical protein ABIN55_01965 [Aeromicrobium sp.]
MTYSRLPDHSKMMLMPMLGTGDDLSTVAIRVLGGGTLASSALATDRAVYVPINIPRPLVAKRMWYVVGATGGTNTIQLGIYTESGSQIVATTATTVGTAANLVHLDITDTTLTPGSYYLAVVLNGTTATILRWGLQTTPLGRLVVLHQAAARPLPATATFAASNDNIVPYIGITTTASP